MPKKAANQKKNNVKNRNQYLRNIIDYSIPGYPVISDWDIPPKPPFSICWIPEMLNDKKKGNKQAEIIVKSA